jgi:Holliday junction DNA helicase RuvB
MTEERLISGKVKRDERENLALRPQHLNDMLGQDRVRENLKIIIEAAKMRKEPLDHTLFYGPPGLGKTSLAHVIANEMGANIRITAGPSIERAGDLAAILTNLKANDVLFIDEVHRLGRAVEEILYPAMEDFALDIIIGKGPAAKNVRLRLPRSPPSRSRCWRATAMDSGYVRRGSDPRAEPTAHRLLQADCARPGRGSGVSRQ